MLTLLFPIGCRKAQSKAPEIEFSQTEELFLHGDLESAQAKADQAIKETSSPDWGARFRLEAAKIRLYRGESDEVIQLLDKGWTLNSADPDLAAQRLTILSLAFARQGDARRAAEAIAAAIQIPSTTASAKAEILAAQGRFELEEDRLVEAESSFQKSLATARAGENRFSESSALVNLSVISLQRDHYEDALEQAEDATRVAKSIGAQLLLQKAQTSAGWAYYGTGDYPRALASFDDATASAIRLGSRLDEETLLNSAGVTEAQLGEFGAAQEHYNRALTLARSLKSLPGIIHADQTLTSLLIHSGHAQAAKKYIDEAADLVSRGGSPYDEQLSNLLDAQYLVQRGDLSQAKTLLLDVERQSRTFPTTLVDAQHTLAQVCDKTGDQKQAEIWFQRSIATYHSQRSELRSDDARLPFFANGRDLYMDYVAYLVRNHRTADALTVIDQGRAETLAEGLGLESKGASTPFQRVSLTTLARQAHAVILVYALSPQGSYLWAANSKQSGFYPLPDRAGILAQVANHRHALLAARDLVAEQQPAARTLYDMLVKPAEHLIHPGDRVFIVGDDGLHGLNFETLLTSGESSHYWIEDVTITNLASLRFLSAPQRQSSAHSSGASPRGLLVIGNPVYSGQQYAPLPNASAEVAGVAAHFPGSDASRIDGCVCHARCLHPQRSCAVQLHPFRLPCRCQ